MLELWDSKSSVVELDLLVRNDDGVGEPYGEQGLQVADYKLRLPAIVAGQWVADVDRSHWIDHHLGPVAVQKEQHKHTAPSRSQNSQVIEQLLALVVRPQPLLRIMDKHVLDIAE